MELSDFIDRVLLAIRRLPKTIRSNRLWLVWAGSLYILRPRMRFSLPPGHSESAARWLIQASFFVRWDAFLFRRRPNPHSAGIYVNELGMFGNMSRRLANSLAITEALGMAAVVVPAHVVFHGGIFKQGPHVMSPSSTLFLGEEPSRAENRISVLLASDLFSDYGLEKSSPLSVDRAWNIARNCLAVSVSPIKAAQPHLTIHVRGGDVFGPRKPSAYGQPPLAFYEVILKSKKWTGVTLVHQDLLNPVIPGIIALCRELKINVAIHSGTIQQDLATLLSAQHLVAGRGTFGPAVAGLARSCTEVYYFENKCAMVPPRSDVTFTRVVDRDGGFTSAVLSHNWQNTDEQRKLMLSYPASSLEIRC